MKKLAIMRALLLLGLCFSCTAAADSRWYYDGEEGKWRLYLSWDERELGSRAPGEVPPEKLDWDLATGRPQAKLALSPVTTKGRSLMGPDSEAIANPISDKWFQDPDDHHWYYLDHNGWMLTGIHELDGIRYRFRDQPHQGNYIPDGMTDSRGSGFYAYRANGRPTYGSLMEILGEPEHGSDRSRRAAESDSSDAARSVPAEERIADASQPAPEKSSASDLPKPDRKASASDISRIDSDMPTDPGDENERRQELEEDEHIHSHTDRDGECCIAYDPWDRILAQPLDYESCFENRCTSRLYLTGEEDFASAKSLMRSPLRHQTGTRQPSCREARLIDEAHIPIYVSLLCAPSESSGSLELVQAYAAEALSLPMRPEASDADAVDDAETLCGNAGGAAASLPWVLLNGGTYRWTEDDGTARSRTYAGCRLSWREDGEYRALPLRKTEVTGSTGFLAETRLVEDIWAYLDWREDGFSGSGTDISFLTRYKGTFHFLSEQNLFGDAAASLPLPERMDRFYPAAEDSWRSTDSYWLGSTPCSGVYVTDLPEYLADPDAALPSAVAGLDDTRARRHYLLYDPAAQLSPALFADPARAERPVGSADAAEAQVVRLRVSVKCG